MIENPLIITGLGALIVIVGLMLVMSRKKKKPKVDFNAEPPF